MRYADTYPLSGMLFRLPQGGISGAVPKGWKVTGGGQPSDDGARPDRRAADPSAVTLTEGDSLRIVFRTVTLDSAAAAFFGKEGLSDLAALTRTLHDSTAGTDRSGIERFTLGGREFASFEAESETGPVRVAVFGSGGNYFECEASAVGRPASRETMQKLFSAQQSILRSLR